MNFTKYQDKLTNEEMHFFEKIFEDKEVQENLQILKKERIKFLIKTISLWLFMIWFFSGIFILDKTTWIISLIILFYIVIWFYYIKKVKIFSNFDENFSNDIIRYRIFEKFFTDKNSESFIAEPEKDEYFILFWKDHEKQVEIIEKIKTWMIENGRLKGMKKVFPAEIITKIQNSKQPKLSGMTLKSRKSPLLTIFITLFVAVLFSSEIIKNGMEVGFSADHLMILSFIYGISFIIIATKYFLNRPTKWFHREIEKYFQINYLNLNLGKIKKFTHQNSPKNYEEQEFNEALSIISNKMEENIIKFFTAENIEILINLKNFAKCPIKIEFTDNKITLKKEVYKLPYYHDPTSSINTNISRYINFYLELKEILKLTKNM